MNNFIRLYNFCTWEYSDKVDSLNKVKSLLECAEESGEVINVLDNDGQIIKILFEDNSYAIMKLLLDYYARNVIAKSDSESDHSSSTKLAEILDDMVDGEEMSDEMREVLGPYIDEDLVHEKHSDTLEFDDTDAVAASNKDVDMSEVFSNAIGGCGASIELTGDSDG